MRWVFLGPPGAGKGTQAGRIAEREGILHISTGDILRRAIDLATPTGVEARGFVDRGELVPLEIVLRLVEDRLQEPDSSRGWIMDGFPRNLEQAQAFSEILERLGIRLDGVACFRISDEMVVRRLSGRRTCRDCGAIYHVEFSPPKRPGICDRCGGDLYQRSDDAEEAIRRRLRVYEEETEPLVRYYEEKGLIECIDAERDVADVASDLDAILAR